MKRKSNVEGKKSTTLRKPHAKGKNLRRPEKIAPPIRYYNGQLVVDSRRGIIYFHLTDKKAIVKAGRETLLRICQLPVPIPENRLLDINNGFGADWQGKRTFRYRRWPRSVED